MGAIGRLALVVAAAAVAGCGFLPILRAGPPIALEHPATGQRVECEAPPVPTGPFGVHGTEQSARMQRECVDDYQQQGYQRVPAKEATR